jgi:hypothetical protein
MSEPAQLKPLLRPGLSVVVGTYMASEACGRLMLRGVGGPTDRSIVAYSDVPGPDAGTTHTPMKRRGLRAEDLIAEAGLAGRNLVISGHQPNYHPYLPLVCKAAATDVFTFADDMAFGRQKFQHRQRLPLSGGPRWLTLPVQRSERRTCIGEKLLDSNPGWRRDHWDAVQRAFSELPHFDLVGNFYEQVYATPWRTVAEIAHALWIPIARQLFPHTLSWNSTAASFDRSGRKGDRIAAELSMIAPGATYLAGAASDYLWNESEVRPGLSYVEVLRERGYETVRPWIDIPRFEAATATSATALAIELIAREGLAASAILRECTCLEPVRLP